MIRHAGPYGERIGSVIFSRAHTHDIQSFDAPRQHPPSAVEIAASLLILGGVALRISRGAKGYQQLSTQLEARVQKHIGKLADQPAELHLWHQLTLGREVRALKLKDEVNALLADAALCRCAHGRGS